MNDQNPPPSGQPASQPPAEGRRAPDEGNASPPESLNVVGWQEWFRALVASPKSARPKGLAADAALFTLRLSSFAYGGAAAARNLLYDAGVLKKTRPNVPIISIGNLTVGGTGKTPMVELLCHQLRERGLRVAILSRGYGTTDGPNDEALLLEENLPDVPHLQGKDRVELAQIACEELESEVLVLDDGFQHRRLGRDLDIVLIDATNPFGGGWQLPGGLLRESLRSLRRAGLVILTRCDRITVEERNLIRQRVQSYNPRAGWAEVRFAPIQLPQSEASAKPITWLQGKRVAAFCGIGNPGSFWSTITDQGAKLVATRTFPDHHAYNRFDIRDLIQWASELSVDAVLTTQKDSVKLRLPALGNKPLLIVRIGAVVESGQNAIGSRLDALLTSFSHRPSEETTHD